MCTAKPFPPHLVQVSAYQTNEATHDAFQEQEREEPLRGAEQHKACQGLLGQLTFGGPPEVRMAQGCCRVDEKETYC